MKTETFTDLNGNEYEVDESDLYPSISDLKREAIELFRDRYNLPEEVPIEFALSDTAFQFWAEYAGEKFYRIYPYNRDGLKLNDV